MPIAGAAKKVLFDPENENLRLTAARSRGRDGANSYNKLIELVFNEVGFLTGGSFGYAYIAVEIDTILNNIRRDEGLI